MTCLPAFSGLSPNISWRVTLPNEHFSHGIAPACRRFNCAGYHTSIACSLLHILARRITQKINHNDVPFTRSDESQHSFPSAPTPRDRASFNDHSNPSYDFHPKLTAGPILKSPQPVIKHSQQRRHAETSCKQNRQQPLSTREKQYASTQM